MITVVIASSVIGLRKKPEKKIVNYAINPDWTNNYSSEDELVKESDLIGIGTIVKEETEKRSDEQNEIKVLLTGGEYANYKTVPFPECPFLDADKRYLLFLEKTEEGYYLPLGGYQGIATIDDSENVSFRDSECRTLFKNLENMKEKDIQNYVKKNIYE